MNTSLRMNLTVKLMYWAVKAKNVLLVFVYIPLLCLTTSWCLHSEFSLQEFISFLTKQQLRFSQWFCSRTPAFWNETLCYWASSSWHIKGSCAFKMSGISYPITQQHIPEDWHLLQINVNFFMQSTFYFIDLYLNSMATRLVLLKWLV